MGNNTGSLPLADLPTENFMCVVISGHDSFTILYGGQREIDAVRTAVLQNWTKGLQEEKSVLENPNNPRSTNRCVKLKLSGYPFLSGDKQRSIESRKMAAQILSSLHNLGWKLLVSSDLSRYDDRTSWFFQRQLVTPDTYKYFSIGLSSIDKLQINDCPENLHSVIRECCVSTWSYGIQEEKMVANSTYEIKLKGSPWSYVNKKESCDSRKMIKTIVQKLSTHQWLLYANSNLKASADTLFFQYNQSLLGGVEFITVSLNRTDRLRFIDMSDSMIAALKETVRQNWPQGVQEVKDSRPMCYELKLKGNPWWAHGDEAVASRFLIVKIMERMASLGYFTTTGIDVSRKENDKSLLLFQRGSPLNTPFMCLSLNELDKVRFINAPQNVIDAGRVIVGRWVLGLQEEKYMQDGVSYQAKLKGNPWCRIQGYDGIHGRAMLLGLLNCFTSMGWRLVCSADVSAKMVHQDKGPDYSIDVHSWYWMYDEVLLVQQQQQQQLMQPFQYDIQPNIYPSLPATAPPSYEASVGFN